MMADDAKTELRTNRLINGPHNLGDPDDLSLRKVETEVLIPKIMRDKARSEKCTDIVKAFEVCCKASSVMMVFSCRKENTALHECLTYWYQEEAFKNDCKNTYLNERREYRMTGISKKQREEAKKQ